jgi:hypothetical protein
MRKIALMCALALVAAPPAFAQDWSEYKSVRD